MNVDDITHMICSGESAVWSSDFPTSILEPFKGLLEMAVSVLGVETAKLWGTSGAYDLPVR